MAQKSNNLPTTFDLKSLSLHDRSVYHFKLGDVNRQNLGNKIENIKRTNGHQATEITKQYAYMGQKKIKK